MSAIDDVEYRRATTLDIPSLIELRTAFLAEFHGSDPNERALREALGRYFSSTIPNGQFVALLAVISDRAIATSGLVFQPTPPSAKDLQGIECYLMNMYTVPSWRGQGIASSLLKGLVGVARQANCRRIRLRANPQAVPMYGRAGFVPVSSEMEILLP
jgi:GNAT superfamily N-acetyltransferase